MNPTSSEADLILQLWIKRIDHVSPQTSLLSRLTSFIYLFGARKSSRGGSRSVGVALHVYQLFIVSCQQQRARGTAGLKRWNKRSKQAALILRRRSPSHDPFS